MISNLPCFSVTREMRIEEWSHEMTSLTGLAATEVIGKLCYETVNRCALKEFLPCDPKGCMSRKFPFVGLQKHGEIECTSPNSSSDYIIVSNPLLIIHFIHQGRPLQQRFIDSHLTSRQKEILLKLVEGYRAQDISKELHISPDTVRTHIKRILESLDVHSQQEAIALFYRTK